MQKVLLVDDEPIVRKALKVLIDWQGLGYRVCGEAGDGKTALDMILTLHPDLVITDLRMPAMDGLSLIQECQRLSLVHIKFIILSGYDEFGYAQQAIKYGVAEYLLKPVDEQELSDALVRLQVSLGQKNRQEQLKREYVQISLRDKLKMIYNHKKATEEGALSLLSADLGIDAQSRFRCVSLWADAQSIGSAVPWDKVGIYLEKHHPAFIIEATDRSIVLLFLLPAMARDQRAFYESLLNEVCRAFDADMLLQAGQIGVGIEALEASIQSLKEIESGCRFYESARVLLHEDCVHLMPCYDVSDIVATDSVIQSLESDGFERVEECLEALFQTIKRKRLRVEAVEMLLHGIVVEIVRIIADLGGESNVLVETYAGFIHGLHAITVDETQSLMLRFCLKVMRYIEQLRAQAGKGVIGEIEKYIQMNYMTDINLKAVATEFHLNSAYLGQQFKKKTGASFNRYIGDIRIKQAKKLLATSDLRIYEIAEQVGYQSTDYFTNKFQASVGQSPTEYRKRHMR
ncbi:response regulator [Eubacteriales bacterium OttesenSCG-928-N13]|nr:response regulator [Eubacteriales bacterium OttesenSCG-928-N13]